MTELLNLFVDLYIIFADAFVEFCMMIMSIFNWKVIKYHILKSFIRGLTNCIIIWYDTEEKQKKLYESLWRITFPDRYKRIINHCLFCHISNLNDLEWLKYITREYFTHTHDISPYILMFGNIENTELLEFLYGLHFGGFCVSYFGCIYLILNNNIDMINYISFNYPRSREYLIRASIYHNRPDIIQHLNNTYGLADPRDDMKTFSYGYMPLSSIYCIKQAYGVDVVRNTKMEIDNITADISSIKALVQTCQYPIHYSQFIRYGGFHLGNSNHYWNNYLLNKYLLRVMVDPENLTNRIVNLNEHPSMIRHLIKINIDSTKLTGRNQYIIENILFKPILEKIIHPHLVGDILCY